MAVPVRPRARLESRRRAMIVAAVIVAALGVLVFKGLGDATVYFKTADEAVRDRSSLGTRRFRIEGVVVPGSLTESGADVRFRIASAGVEAPVHHSGDPPELFREGIAVVLEGHWRGATYDSDRILVKHSTQYKAKHPDRVR